MTFATGMPISNSMTELYTNMRYLQITAQRMGTFENYLPQLEDCLEGVREHEALQTRF